MRRTHHTRKEALPRAFRGEDKKKSSGGGTPIVIIAALLGAEEECCTKEMLAICALFSLQSVFRQLKPADLAVARAKFAVYEGDALMLLNVYKA